MSDIYGASPKFGDAFSVEETTLTFDVGDGTDGGLGALIQSASTSYVRPVQRIFELGPDKKTYYVAGRAEGQMGIQRLAAPGPVNYCFLEKFANLCCVATNNLAISTSPGYVDDDRATQCRDTGEDSGYQFRYCLIGSLQFSVSVQAIALTEALQLTFASMIKNNASCNYTCS